MGKGSNCAGDELIFNDIFNYVQKYLVNNDGEYSKIGKFPFRKRSEHIWRVFIWAKRLIDQGVDIKVDRNSTLIAALFHDIGYSQLSDDVSHAENSAKIFRQYAREENYGDRQLEFIEFLISNHSHKKMLHCDKIPLELVILMEADLLDETGALSIVWDCMMEGNQPIQSFTKSYNHIKSMSGKILESNPMRTIKAKEYWVQKQKLVRNFLDQLAFDLVFDEYE